MRKVVEIFKIILNLQPNSLTKIWNINKNFSLRQKSDLIVRKVNYGYVSVQGVKEYFKKGITDPDESYPDQPENLKETFQTVYQTLQNIADEGLKEIATYTYKDSSTHYSAKLYSEVAEIVQKRSSISLIHYYAQDEKKTTDYVEKHDPNREALEEMDFHAKGKEKVEIEKEEETDDKEKENSDKRKVVTPSATHTDTGLLTLISCSFVPGLQVLDRASGAFLDVEKIADPGKDLFIIMGRKITQLSTNHSGLFIPTTHRVVLPPNTERNSILYFQDVGQI
eukprot:TRINITY_DN11513_c0_g1_i1.p1 TRINITY_DN11513_c0_g1~~TRINITY_DN11513_c0_g1_i1.p1  ORF type:complete len:281 (-),score=49.62 TRINITY_DN11513_c0_g1_i1:8-850(-)